MNGFLDINGNRIYYEEHGEGEPLLLLHGNGEDHTVFADQITYFVPHYRVITIDSRGHGKSSGKSAELSYEALADDVQKVLEVLKIEKCSIIGFSDGGIVALLLAMQIPTKIHCMIVIGANYSPSGLKLLVRAGIWMSYMAYTLRCYMDPRSEKWRWKRQLMQLMLFHPHLSLRDLEKKIEIPVLFVVGDRDMIRLRHSEILAGSLNNANLWVIEDCNHFVLQQQAAVFNGKALDFLDFWIKSLQ